MGSNHETDQTKNVIGQNKTGGKEVVQGKVVAGNRLWCCFLLFCCACCAVLYLAFSTSC